MIYVIGDSHCLSLNTPPFSPYLIAGGQDGATAATAYGLGKESSRTNSRKRVLAFCKTLKGEDTIILCFGEVDCRNHIYNQYKKQGLC